MSPAPGDSANQREQRWANDASVLRAGWVWWPILLLNMAVFAWGLRGVDRFSVVPLSCVWLGAFSCCMIFHIESVKRILALRGEVEELRRALAAKERSGDGDRAW